MYLCAHIYLFIFSFWASYLEPGLLGLGRLAYKPQGISCLTFPGAAVVYGVYVGAGN